MVVNRNVEHDTPAQLIPDYMTLNDWVPQPGQWPVDPQEDEPVSKDRIWLDGCFDFSHHGEDKAIRGSGAAD